MHLIQGTKLDTLCHQFVTFSLPQACPPDKIPIRVLPLSPFSPSVFASTKSGPPLSPWQAAWKLDLIL